MSTNQLPAHWMENYLMNNADLRAKIREKDPVLDMFVKGYLEGRMILGAEMGKRLALFIEQYRRDNSHNRASGQVEQ